MTIGAYRWSPVSQILHKSHDAIHLTFKCATSTIPLKTLVSMAYSLTSTLCQGNLKR